MAIFNQANTAKKETPSFADEGRSAPPVSRETPAAAEFSPTQAAPPRGQSQVDVKESLIASDLTIEGKIEGSGHVRIAGKFKGDVNVKGDLTIEKSAKLNGSVRANKVTVAGELEGNIESALRVELLDTAVMTGDLKAGSLTVAAGSKIRGQVECGWDSSESQKFSGKNGKADNDLNS